MYGVHSRLVFTITEVIPVCSLLIDSRSLFHMWLPGSPVTFSSALVWAGATLNAKVKVGLVD